MAISVSASWLLASSRNLAAVELACVNSVPMEHSAVPRFERALGSVAGVAEATALVAAVRFGTMDWKYAAVSSRLTMVFMSATTLLAKAGFDGFVTAASMSVSSAMR